MTLVYGLPVLGSVLRSRGGFGGSRYHEFMDPLLTWRKEFPILGTHHLYDQPLAGSDAAAGG